MSSIEIRPLNPTTGVEGHGVDLSAPLSEAARIEIRMTLGGDRSVMVG